MLKNGRRAISVAAIISVLFSIILLSNPPEARASFGFAPRTLLKLYLSSDVIVLAEVRSEKFLGPLDEDRPESYIEVKKNIQVLKIYKGSAEEGISFTCWESRSKDQVENFQAPVEPYTFEGSLRYFGAPIRSAGQRYVFFLDKDKNNGAYTLNDRISGAWEIRPGDAPVVDDRLDEFGAILRTKKRIYRRLAEWMVRLIEEPETRSDGVADLRESFFPVSPVVLRRTIGNLPAGSPFDEWGNSSKIAANLTDSHKARISAVLNRQLQDELISNKPFDPFDGSESLIILAGNWDKLQFSSQVYALLQKTDKGDENRVYILMKYLTYTILDRELQEITLEYGMMHFDRDPGNAGEGTQETEKTADTEVLKGFGNGTGDLAERDEGETPDEVGDIIKQPAETTVLRISQMQYFDPIDKEKDVEIRTDNEQGEAGPIVATETRIQLTDQNKGLSLKEKRRKLLERFLSRFEYLISRNFSPDN